VVLGDGGRRAPAGRGGEKETGGAEIVIALGQTVDDLPLTDPSDIPAYYGTLPYMRSNSQVCVVGSFSDDPLIPGICNPTLLLGAAVLFGVLWWLNR
jgi:hypothetical protein